MIKIPFVIPNEHTARAMAFIEDKGYTPEIVNKFVTQRRVPIEEKDALLLEIAGKQIISERYDPDPDAPDPDPIPVDPENPNGETYIPAKPIAFYTAEWREVEVVPNPISPKEFLSDYILSLVSKEIFAFEIKQKIKNEGKTFVNPLEKNGA